MIRRTLSASWPLVKNEKKYYQGQPTCKQRESPTHFVNGKGFVVINDTDFGRVGEVQYRALFYLEHVLYGQGDLDTVALVVRTEDDLLDRLDPLTSTGCAIRLELVVSLIGCDHKARLFFALALGFLDVGRDGILEVDAIARKV